MATDAAPYATTPRVSSAPRPLRTTRGSAPVRSITVVGTTPHRYLVERRVAHAARLLVTTGVPVAEICFASGFGSVARFQSAFRRAWGITPTQYRAAGARSALARSSRTF